MNNNSSPIEIAGTNTVEKLFNDMDGYVLPCINAQEKGIAWDGHFEYYSKGIQDKKHYYNDCKIQIKGQLVKENDMDRKIISYKVDMETLYIYQKKGGVIFFVVRINKNNPECNQAYYYSLLPYDISNIIKNKVGVKAPTIKLKKVPNTIGKRRNLVKRFIDNSTEQMKSYNMIIPTFKDVVVDIDKWDMGIITPLDQLFDEPIYIYRSPKGIPNFKQAIMKVQIESISQLLEDVEIALDNKIYYNKLNHLTDKDNKHIIKFGKCLELTFGDDDIASIKFTPKGKIDDIIKDAMFIKDMLSANVLRIGKFKSDLVNQKYEGIDYTLEFTKKIKQLFKKMNVDKEIDLTVCTEKMYNDLMVLYECIVKGGVINCELNEKCRICSVNIYGAHIPVITIKNQNDKMRVYDLFDISNGKFTIGWGVEKYEGMRTTIYTMLCKEDFIGISKKNCDTLKKCIKDIDFNKFHDDRLLDMLLEMVKAYYEEHSNHLFDVIKYLARYLHKNDPSIINFINYCMVCDIDGKLTEKNRKKLEKSLQSIIDDENGNKYELAIYILLDKKVKFQGKFSSLTKLEKEEFNVMPIMKLAETKFGRITRVINDGK